MEEVNKRCADKEACKVPVNNGVFGDSCPRVRKYLEVSYQCINQVNSMTACEGSQMR